MSAWCVFEARAEPCDCGCESETGWRRLLADLEGAPSGPGRLVAVLSRPVGAEPQWPRTRLDALWRGSWHGEGPPTGHGEGPPTGHGEGPSTGWS